MKKTSNSFFFVYSFTPKIFMEAIHGHTVTQSQYNAAISHLFSRAGSECTLQNKVYLKGASWSARGRKSVG